MSNFSVLRRDSCNIQISNLIFLLIRCNLNTVIYFVFRQEGVDTNWYFAKSVNVMTSDGVSVQCRTYQQTINPPLRKNGEELPLERRPCITYLDCIIKGAVECELPEYYIEELKKIPHNGQIASAKMLEKLNSQ